MTVQQTSHPFAAKVAAGGSAVSDAGLGTGGAGPSAVMDQGVEAGLQLPTEKDLAAMYGVSRITVRQALAALADHGYVERRQGMGTFVADRPRLVQHDVGLMTPWRDRFRAAGEKAVVGPPRPTRSRGRAVRPRPRAEPGRARHDQAPPQASAPRQRPPHRAHRLLDRRSGGGHVARTGADRCLGLEDAGRRRDRR